jgi:hypothetical protein
VARTGNQQSFKVGDRIHFGVAMEKAQYFDRETELSIQDGPAGPSQNPAGGEALPKTEALEEPPLNPEGSPAPDGE